MAIKIQLQNLPKELRKEGLEKKLSQICQKNDITFMVIFGSFAKGKQTRKSDIDIAIEFEKNSKKTLLDLIRIERELGKIFRRKVDLGIFSSINPHVIDHVKKEMIILYEKR
ncbi:MAG: nucleotidyltransferase family protein [Candidatus Bathyarchaeia archaeon]